MAPSVRIQRAVVPDRSPVPSHVPSGPALLAFEVSREAHGIRGLDVLGRHVDRAPPGLAS